MFQSPWTYTTLQICHPISYLYWDASHSPSLPRETPPELSILVQIPPWESLSFPSGIDHSFLSAIKALRSMFGHGACCIVLWLQIYGSVSPLDLRWSTARAVICLSHLHPMPTTRCKGKLPNFKLQPSLQPPSNSSNELPWWWKVSLSSYNNSLLSGNS